jgi:hypothetical protein
MAKRPTPASTTPVTRDDLEQGFRGLQRVVRREVDDRRSTIIGIVGGVATLVVVIVFVLGRRSGKKKTTYVEIRRV